MNDEAIAIVTVFCPCSQAPSLRTLDAQWPSLEAGPCTLVIRGLSEVRRLALPTNSLCGLSKCVDPL